MGFDSGYLIVFSVVLLVLSILMLIASKKIAGSSPDKKIKRLNIGLYVLMAISIVCIVVLLIFRGNPPNTNDSEIVTLTDSYIKKDLMNQDSNKIVMIVIISVVTVPLALAIIIGTIKSYKKWDEKTKKDAKFAIPVIVIIFAILIGVVVDKFGYKSDVSYKDWYITIENISEKRIEVIEHSQIRDSGHLDKSDEYQYFARLNYIEGEVQISKEEYERISEGDEVYAVKDKDGNVRGIYSLNKYKYTGNKLR